MSLYSDISASKSFRQNNKAIRAHLLTIEEVLKEKATQASLVHSMVEDIKKLKIDHKDELDKKDVINPTFTLEDL
jgi:hypothetical protein